jgi:hypothetical protein
MLRREAVEAARVSLSTTRGRIAPRIFAISAV